jgi:hypothetical protein
VPSDHPFIWTYCLYFATDDWLEALVSDFKNSNEEYLEIKQAAEEKVKTVLTNSKLLLKFATFSVIESLRSNPELYNFVLYDGSVNLTI